MLDLPASIVSEGEERFFHQPPAQARVTGCFADRRGFGKPGQDRVDPSM
ncbi:hypothetical protein ACQEU5_21415 [Marinactinospora thermotolerans]|nr:hypothetical protein [Marinactinospora thermotolerans]